MTYAYRECPRGLFARILSDEGIPTKMDRGLKAGPTKRPENRGQWSRSTISGMLRNKDYTGQGSRMKSLPQGERIGCPIPAIIDEETFQAVQALLARNKALAKRNRRREYLFTGGRLRCGRCGRAMVGKTVGNLKYYYCCSKIVFPSSTRGCEGCLRGDKAETDVWQAVERVLVNPELIAQEVARQQESSGEIRAEVEREMELLEASLGKCDREERRWSEAYANEVISLAELKGYKAEIATRRGSLQAHKVELQAREESLAQATAKTESLVAYCERVRENLKSFSFEEKRIALEALDIRVTWTPGQPLEIRGNISTRTATGAMCSGVAYLHDTPRHTGPAGARGSRWFPHRL